MASDLKILLADDEAIVHETIGDYVRECGHTLESVTSGTAAEEAIRTGDYDLALVDVRMPGLDGLDVLARSQEVAPETPVVLITGHGNMEMAIEALRLGAADFLNKPVKLLELEAVLEKSAHIRELRKDRLHLKQTIGSIQRAEGMSESNRTYLGDSPSTQMVREQIQLAIDVQCDTVLVSGETGTGKEVVAREIHYGGSGEDSPFIPVCCPALPEQLVESELFGHMKGAFTGAEGDKPGYFELADGGTLFLDEIADLSADAQAKLLRALETRSFRRVGGTEETHVELRVIAASNANLSQLVEAGDFRSDLYYRLNLLKIDLLPLRERPEDIVPLANRFVESYAQPRGLNLAGFTRGALELLAAYDYPGNARELRNIIERAAMLCRTGRIGSEHLRLDKMGAFAESRHATRTANGKEEPGSATTPTDDGSRNTIVEALEEARWNRRAAAAALGISYSTLRYKIRKYEIE